MCAAGDGGLDGVFKQRLFRKFAPMSRTVDVRIGTAGWSIPRAAACRFESAGTHLERYARLFRCAEINSSFHRPHAANDLREVAQQHTCGFPVRRQDASDDYA